MFCSNLRQRFEWAPVVSNLVQSQAPKWKEKNLDTHDIALPLYRSTEQDEYLRILLLSASDIQSSSNGIERIERLYHLDGGRHIGIVFLLREKGCKSDGIVPLMELQSKLMSMLFELPVLPLHSVLSLQAALFTYQRHFLRAQPTHPPANPALTILPYCTINPPIPEHMKHVLSDIFHDIKDIAAAATTRDGQAFIKQFIDKPERQDELIGFWTEEYTLD